MPFARTTVAIAFYLMVTCVAAQETSGPKFGGPNAVEVELEEQYESWGDWQKALKEDHGFAFSFDYTAVLLTASGTVSDSTGAGGIARIYGA